MPVRGGPSNGPELSAASLPIVFKDFFTGLVIADGATLTTPSLHAENLPGINVWALQLAGPGICTVHIEFANGNDQALPNISQWRRVIQAYALAVNTESLVNARLGSHLWRVRFVASGGAVTMGGYRLTASLT